MPLILAIVADHHQAAQITALVKRLNVDLVQAAEVGEGLLALNDRIPDLVLTSPLMSPFDDGVLDEYLRDLGPAGAHVQSLRIPVLSTSSKKSKGGGFSLFGRSKVTHTLEGCDPKLFADEITQYLMRAAEEKQNAQDQAQSGSRPHEAVPPGDEWATTPGPGAVVEDEEKWDPLAWQAEARSSEPSDTPAPEYIPMAPDTPAPVYNPMATDTPAPVYKPMATDAPAPVYNPIAMDAPTPVYNPIAMDAATPVYNPIAGEPAYSPAESEPAYGSSESGSAYSPIDSSTDYSPVEHETVPASTETTAQEVLQAADVPAADVYVPEPAIETPTPSSLIREDVEPPAAHAFEATAYAPIAEEPASMAPDPLASVVLPEDPSPEVPTPDLLASVVLPADPSPDPDEPVVRAPLSLFEGVEAATDPALFLPSVEEPTVREPQPLTLFGGVDATTDPTEYLRPIVAESMFAEPFVADPVATELIAAEPIAAEPILAEPFVAEPIAAEPIAAPIIAAPIVAPPPERPFFIEAFTTPKADVVTTPVEEQSAEVVAAPEPIAPPTPVVAAAAVPDPPAAPPASPAPVAEKPVAPKLTASFRAALAAIRKAWDAPSVAHAKAAPSVEEKPSETIAPAQAEAPIQAEAPLRTVAPIWTESPAEAIASPATAPAEAPPAIEAIAPAEAAAPIEPVAAPEPPAAFDVDLTGVVELIDSEPAVEHMPEFESQPLAVQPLEPPVDVGRLGEPEASEVWEITVEPDLQELESKLLAPLEPHVSKPSPSEEPVSRARETAAGEGRSSKDAPRGRRGKSSKKGGKATKPRPQDKEPVQDEWGIFDPERCGFAALVDKLEEVSEEKEQAPRKGTKVRVISYS